MLFGYLFLRKRYSITQVVRFLLAFHRPTTVTGLKFSVIIVSLGVSLATLSRSSSSHHPAQSSMQSVADDAWIYTVGITMLITSCLLYAVLGLMQEQAYQKYGPCWREGVFYTVGCFCALLKIY